MKKLVLSVFSALLILGFVNSPVQVGAASKAPELVEPSAYLSKNVSVSKTYASFGSVPKSISYSKDGYSGTLYLSGSAKYDGERWVAIFTGTVYKYNGCTSTGACVSQ